MKLTPELCEIAGMIAADGCVQKNYVCMWGNIFEDKSYYDDYMAPLFEKQFDVKLNVHEKKSNSVYGFYLCRREVVKFLGENFGFNEGVKTYSVKVPEKIIDSRNKKFYASFIRGFTDCDGCLNFHKSYGKYSYFKRTFHHYPRIMLSSVSPMIIQDMSEMLDFLGIKHFTRLHKAGLSYYAEVKGVDRLERWMDLISFKNPAKLTKYMIWEEFGFCPPNTSLIDRFKMLKKE
ncbi:hypothetical protein H0N95_00425, partial [Candidatus Micrarchaeota archaeon]|nr:hypothetical protein [Candidatus Micrarchaeota archaeon]